MENKLFFLKVFPYVLVCYLLYIFTYDPSDQVNKGTKTQMKYVNQIFGDKPYSLGKLKRNNILNSGIYYQSFFNKEDINHNLQFQSCK